MKRITQKAIVDFCRGHKVGSQIIDGLTLFQYVQDEDGTIYAVIPVKDFIRKENKMRAE